MYQLESNSRDRSRSDKLDGHTSSEENFDLWVQLANTRLIMLKARRKELHRYGITPTLSSFLFAIGEIGDQVTPPKIARRVLREPHTVSEYLNKMERDGLIIKTKDLVKKNQVRVELTEKGTKLLGIILHKRDSINSIMSALSRRQSQQLKTCLFTLADAAFEELGLEGELLS